MRKIYVQFVVPAFDACAYYRMQQIMFASMTNPRLNFTGTHARLGSLYYIGQDVLYTQRVMTEPLFRALREFKEKTGVKIVIDYDDLMWESDEMPEYNRALDRSIAPACKKAMSEWLPEVADAVTCSTGYLAMRLSEVFRGGDVRVIPNCLDERWLFDFAGWDDGKILYAGSNTHYSNDKKLYGDWDIPLVNYVKQKGVKVMGSAPWFLEGAETHPGCPMYMYPVMLHELSRDCGFVVAPLTANNFNRSKSDLKYLETAAVGKIALVSGFDGSPYRGAHPLQKIRENASIGEIAKTVENCKEHYEEILEFQYNYLSSRWLSANMYRYEELFESIM